VNQFSDKNHQADRGFNPGDKRFDRQSVVKAGIAAGVGIRAGATAPLLGSEQSEQIQSRRANTSELLDLAMQAHGGLDRWRQVQSVDVRVSTTGGLFRLKGYPEGMPKVNLKIDVRRQAVTVTPYARPDGRGFFTPDRVWIADGAGRIVAARNHPRVSFAGHVYVAIRPASRYCFDDTTFGRIVFPTLRRVVGRSPSRPRLSGPTSVLIQITDVTVT
jgi:hypothetical protein